MDNLFDIKTSFNSMKSCQLFTDGDQDLHKRIFDRFSEIIQPRFNELSVLLTRACYEHIPNVINSGGILALSRVDRLILLWQSIWTIITNGTDQFDKESEKTAFRNYLLFNASISPADITEIDQPLFIAPPLDTLPDYKAPIDSVDQQRYNTQLGFIINSVSKQLVFSKDGRGEGASKALSEIFPNMQSGNRLVRHIPNMQSGDRFVRHIPVTLYKIAHAFSVKTKVLLENAQGGAACKRVLNGLLLDRDLKSKTAELLRKESRSFISDNVIDYLFELLVKADIRSLLKHGIRDSGLSVIDTPALPLRTALTVISKVNK